LGRIARSYNVSRARFPDSQPRFRVRACQAITPPVKYSTSLADRQ
jgi:hypothetical protein